MKPSVGGSPAMEIAAMPAARVVIGRRRASPPIRLRRPSPTAWMVVPAQKNRAALYSACAMMKAIIAVTE